MTPTAAETADGGASFDALLADILENPGRVLDKDLTPEQNMIDLPHDCFRLF